MWPLFALLLGLLVGSFLNVVIHRLPRGESVVHPPSRCPACGSRLGPLDLFPVLSWLFLKGRCRHCKAPISPRYPLVEGLTGGAFLLLALRFPPPLPFGERSLEALFAFLFVSVLIALAFIDLDTYELPDPLTYGLLALGLLSGLQGGFSEALDGALRSAGLLGLVAGYGNLVLRRGKDVPPDHPVGTHQVHLAALAGAALGGGVGMAVGFGNWALNARVGRPLVLPDLLSLGLFPLALFLRPDPLQALLDGLLAAGGLALAGGLYWAVRDRLFSGSNPSRTPMASLMEGQASPAFGPPKDPNALVQEKAPLEAPVAMGYGDVKLLGALGAWVGLKGAVLSLFLAALLGALFGLLFGQRKIPFGPYLALGGFVALLFGEDLIRAYLAWIGL
ncbi:MAG: prepilin peptidase [Thermus sp.]